MWEQRVTDQMILAVAQSGAKLALADYLPRSFFTTSERGVFWLDSQKAGRRLESGRFRSQPVRPFYHRDWDESQL